MNRKAVHQSATEYYQTPHELHSIFLHKNIFFFWKVGPCFLTDNKIVILTYWIHKKILYTILVFHIFIQSCYHISIWTVVTPFFHILMLCLIKTNTAVVSSWDVVIKCAWRFTTVSKSTGVWQTQLNSDTSYWNVFEIPQSICCPVTNRIHRTLNIIIWGYYWIPSKEGIIEYPQN